MSDYQPSQADLAKFASGLSKSTFLGNPSKKPRLMSGRTTVDESDEARKKWAQQPAIAAQTATRHTAIKGLEGTMGTHKNIHPCSDAAFELLKWLEEQITDEAKANQMYEQQATKILNIGDYHSPLKSTHVFSVQLGNIADDERRHRKMLRAIADEITRRCGSPPGGQSLEKKKWLPPGEAEKAYHAREEAYRKKEAYHPNW